MCSDSMRLPRRIILCLAAGCFALCAVLAGCAVDSGSGNEEEGNYTEDQTTFNISGVTDTAGKATVSFNVAEGTTKFSVTALANDEAFLKFLQFKSATGVNYLTPNGESVSFGTEYFPYVNVVVAPPRPLDPAVDDAERYSLIAQAVTDPSNTRSGWEGKTVTFAVNSKADPDLMSGQLRFNLFYVGDVGADQTTRDVVGQAMNYARSLLDGGAHIALNISEYDIEGPVQLPSPMDGSEFYRDASAGVISPAVNMFIGGDIAGLGSAAADTLGLSAGIPGPPIPSERSAIAISIFTGAGPDGIYSADDVRLLGETLAHETGHYLGLFHPVDFTGNTVSASDPLTDTNSCSFITECVGDIALIDNLMFPSPIPNGEGSYRSQYIITDQQRATLNRYIVVD